MESEHPEAFGDALADVQARLPAEWELGIDRLWGDPPHRAVARWESHVVTGNGDTPAAALRDLARQLPPSSSSA